MVTIARFQKSTRAFSLAIAVVMGVWGLMACSASNDIKREDSSPPQLKLGMQAKEIGPGRTDIVLTVTNVGLVDVLLAPTLTLPANAGSDRDYGPTTRANTVDGEGREIASTTRVIKAMTWVPERLRAGVTLTWGVALRCYDRQPITVGALVKSVQVGGVREAPFDELSRNLPVSCRPPVSAGSLR
tara:strand:+ start:199 stop:756 length:558 start_codon:yes stop_codon:yes gene_type:complete